MGRPQFHSSVAVVIFLVVQILAMMTQLPITSDCLMDNKSITAFDWFINNNSLVEFDQDQLLHFNGEGAAQQGELLDLDLEVMHMVDSEETSRRILGVQNPFGYKSGNQKRACCDSVSSGLYKVPRRNFCEGRPPYIQGRC